MMNPFRRLRRLASLDLEPVAFIAFVCVSQLFILHGKAVSDHFLNGTPSLLNVGFHWLDIYFLAIVPALIFQAIRLHAPSIFHMQRLSLLIMVTVVGIPAWIQWLSTLRSPLVLVTQFFFLAVMGGIVIVERIFSQDLKKDFWKQMNEGSIKTIRTILTLYTAGLAVLKFVSSGLGETIPGFISSLVYPSVILVVGVAAILYWIALPSWLQVIEASKEIPAGKARSHGH